MKSALSSLFVFLFLGLTSANADVQSLPAGLNSGIYNITMNPFGATWVANSGETSRWRRI